MPGSQFYVPRGDPAAPWTWVPPQNFEINALYGAVPLSGMWTVDCAQETFWQWSPPVVTLTQPSAAPSPSSQWRSDFVPIEVWVWNCPSTSVTANWVIPPIYRGAGIGWDRVAVSAVANDEVAVLTITGDEA